MDGGRARGRAAPKAEHRLHPHRRPELEPRPLHAIAANGIGIAGIEFITDAAGELYTYDVNTNTNYNSAAEAEAGIYGMRAVAAYLGDELKKLQVAR